jgi:hypothetical protein
MLPYCYGIGGWGGEVGIATHYGLGDLGIQSWMGKNFYTHPGQSWGPPNYLYNPEFPCWEVNGLGCDINHPLPSSTDVKVRAIPLLHLRNIMACSGVNVTFIAEFNVFKYLKFILLLNFEQCEKH